MKTTESIYSKTEAEYKKMDKLYAKTRELFDTLKALEEANAYGSEKWNEVWAKYVETFKKAHGYRPIWAR